MASQEPAKVAILVVEDQPEMRQLICDMLEASQFVPVETGSAELGLGLLKTHPGIRLAIIDMVMPGMSGLDLAAEMSRAHPGIRILYISGYAASVAIQAIADRNPDAVLLKPFTEARLIDRINRILGLPGGPAGDIEPIPPTLQTAWDRLIEGSDNIPYPYRIAAYRNTSAAYSIAAAHAAVLRQAGLPYHFDRLADATHPFELLAPAERWHEAVKCIKVLGLSADIAIAA